MVGLLMGGGGEGNWFVGGRVVGFWLIRLLEKVPKTKKMSTTLKSLFKNFFFVLKHFLK